MASFIFWFSYVVFFILAVVYGSYAFLLYVQKKRYENALMKKDLSSTYIDQIETANGLLNLIDNHIAVEIRYHLREYMSLNKAYDVLKIDQDCNDIALTVFHGIDVSVMENLQNACPIYTDSFWMNYIVRKTTCDMLTAVKEWNRLMTPSI